MKCEAEGCTYPGAIWREDHQAALCNNHAELPSYGPQHTPLRMKPKPRKTFRDRLVDVIFAGLCYALYPFILAGIMFKRLGGAANDA